MRSIFSAVALLFAAAVAADTKPGLWEMTMKSDQIKGEHMANLTPEQKQQMQKMGIPVPTIRDGAVVQQVCITKDVAQRMMTPGAPHESQRECKVVNQNKSGNAFQADVICDGPDIKGKGTLKGGFSGDTSYTSTYDFKGTARGREISNHHETSGKWLSADCGNVKPMNEWLGHQK
jgi:hypothetical protein